MWCSIAKTVWTKSKTWFTVSNKCNTTPRCVLVLDRGPQIWQLLDPFIHIWPTIPPSRFAQRSKSDYSEQIQISLLKKHHRYQIATKRQKSSWETYQSTTVLHNVWALGLFIIPPHLKRHTHSFSSSLYPVTFSSFEAWKLVLPENSRLPKCPNKAAFYVSSRKEERGGGQEFLGSKCFNFHKTGWGWQLEPVLGGGFCPVRQHPPDDGREQDSTRKVKVEIRRNFIVSFKLVDFCPSWSLSLRKVKVTRVW